MYNLIKFSSGNCKLCVVFYLELVVIFKNNVQIKELKTNIQIEITSVGSLQMLETFKFFNI